MAARATRSASPRREEAVATGPLGALSHDELGVIFDGLADPLQPVVAVALSSTCLGLRTPLRAALAVLEERHARAVALLRKAGRYDAAADYFKGQVGLTCEEVRGFKGLNFSDDDLENFSDDGHLALDDIATLGTIMPWLPKLRVLQVETHGLGPAGINAFLGCCGIMPSLIELRFSDDDEELGPSRHPPSIAGALPRGALPKLEKLGLHGCRLGNQGMAVLMPTLRKLPALKTLYLGDNDLGGEGFAPLVTGLDKDDFKALTGLFLHGNDLDDANCDTLARSLSAGAFPMLKNKRLDTNEIVTLHDNSGASAAALKSVMHVLDARGK